MKHLLAFILIIFIYGCGNAYDTNKVTLVRAFKNTGNWDSVYLYSDGHLIIVRYPDDYEKSKIKTADSIVFHYDSILVIHYNRSEVK